MREIKFRLRVGNKIIAYQKFNEEDGRLNTWFLEWDKEPLWRVGDCTPRIHEKIDRDQFTGRHDKNGVEIYEGDIVLVNGTKSKGKYNDVVVFEHAGFKLLENATYLNNDRSLIGVTVIGNIHQNPELIKESK